MSALIPDGIISFIIISIGLILVPGPNVMVIVSTSLLYGKTRGLQTVAGTSIAMILQLATVAFSTAVFVAGLNKGLLVLKWLGIAYLLYLAFIQFKSLFLLAGDGDVPQVETNAMSSFRRGFFVSLLNPKTLIFFSAFLPQFITDPDAYLTQILFLSAVFWSLALCLDSSFALLAGKVKSLVQTSRYSRAKHGVVGGLYLFAAALLSRAKV